MDVLTGAREQVSTRSRVACSSDVCPTTVIQPTDAHSASNLQYSDPKIKCKHTPAFKNLNKEGNN